MEETKCAACEYRYVKHECCAVDLVQDWLDCSREEAMKIVTAALEKRKYKRLHK